MSKFYFSILKNIESQFKINLSQINQYINSSNLDGYQKYKNVTHLCIGDIQNTINNNSQFQFEVVQHILIISKIKPNLPYQSMILDMIIHASKLSQSDIVQEIIQNYQFNQQGQIHLLDVICNCNYTIQKLLLNNLSSIQELRNVQDVDQIFKILANLMKLNKSNLLTEESVANFSDLQYDFWLKNTENNDIQIQKEDVIKIMIKELKDKVEWLIKKGQKVSSNILIQYIQQFKQTTEITFDDIRNQNYSKKEEMILFNLLKSQEQFDIIKTINYIKQNHSSYNLQYVYKFLNNQQTVDLNLLQIVEDNIQNERVRIQNLLQFYSTIPVEPSWKIAQILRNILIKEWDKMTISQQLTIVGQLFRIERLIQKPEPIGKFFILDTILISKIEQMILQLRFQDLSQLDRLKVYFLMNSYFGKDLLSSYFNTQYALYIQAYLRNQFQTQPRNQSKLQKQVEESLIKNNVFYERETLVENCFAVDFKLKNTIIEVNGPYHYCSIIGDTLPNDALQYLSTNQAMYETLKTSLKTRLLTKKGYRVINIPYFKWDGWCISNKQDKILNDMLEGISLKDSELLSKI
ncbi:unnamed protein product [Paramecium pentaurelia]|uniref:RAP domain-containing protein n=1 Tax=Paramecium pentaurelia TaxID=43138 RepID=A0A8S1XGW6_9CILI|nr:unnamed protein product [Paramecium pentaurelia]